MPAHESQPPASPQAKESVLRTPGITASGEWRRLYPVRFRLLVEDQRFARWQWVNYAWRLPNDDNRRESRRIEENTLQPGAKLAAQERLAFLTPLLRASTREAAARGESLALIEPRSLTMRVKKKPAAVIDAERAAFEAAARQQSLLDPDMPPFEPCPYAVAIPFTDQDGVHHAPQCGDWETTATFFNMRRRGASDADIIAHLRAEFTEPRSDRRIILAMGTVKARPQQWLLLGVLRVKAGPVGQFRLPI